MENINNNIVIPTQTLSNRECQMLRNSAIKIMSELKIKGICNIKFVLNPKSFEYAVTEVNYGTGSLSELTSKATGYPVIETVNRIELGYYLDEIEGACLEPVLNNIYKFPCNISV